MRFLLEFELEKLEIDTEYRKKVMHFIKNCISCANDGKYYSKFYDGTKQKNFTFSVLLDDPKFNDGLINLASNSFKVEFSILDKMEGYLFYASFLDKVDTVIAMNYDNDTKYNSMKLLKVTQLPEETITGKEMMIEMKAPLLIRKHNQIDGTDWYYASGDDDFEEHLHNILSYQLSNFGFSQTSVNSVEIIPIRTKKLIVKHYDCQYPATLGQFYIKADTIILNYLLKCGMCSRKSEGFGYLKLLSQN